MHLLEAAGDRGVETDLELAEQVLHVGLREPRVGEGADADLAVEESRWRPCVLQRELAVEARLGPGTVDVAMTGAVSTTRRMAAAEGIFGCSSSAAVMPKWVPNWLGNILMA